MVYRDMGQTWGGGTSIDGASRSAWVSWTKGPVFMLYDIYKSGLQLWKMDLGPADYVVERSVYWSQVNWSSGLPDYLCSENLQF